MNNQVLKSEDMVKKLSYFCRLRMPSIVVLLILLGFSVTVNATEYIVDKAASKVKWEAKKVTGQHYGSISFENGSVSVTDHKISGGTFVVDMKSMVDEDLTNADMKKKLMGHLASDDFFSIEKFPESQMVIKKVTSVSGDDFSFLADLTIKGITSPVEFTAKVKLNGNQLNADGVITVNRTNYGIKYGSGKFFQGLGDKMIYDDFTLSFNVVAREK